MTSPKNFEQQMAKPVEEVLDDLHAEFERYTPDDFHERIEWWACFN
jgi:antitoxin component of MazEF toxin-antitoxin module